MSRGKSNLDETQIKNENKFTKLIMEKLDNNIALVAQGEINKLDVRGGQLGARENLIYLLNNLTETSIIREFILKHINIP